MCENKDIRAINTDPPMTAYELGKMHEQNRIGVIMRQHLTKAREAGDMHGFGILMQLAIDIKGESSHDHTRTSPG